VVLILRSVATSNAAGAALLLHTPAMQFPLLQSLCALQLNPIKHLFGHGPPQSMPAFLSSSSSLLQRVCIVGFSLGTWMSLPLTFTLCTILAAKLAFRYANINSSLSKHILTQSIQLASLKSFGSQLLLDKHRLKGWQHSL
jgi:hypothetical protein